LLRGWFERDDSVRDGKKKPRVAKAGCMAAALDERGLNSRLSKQILSSDGQRTFAKMIFFFPIFYHVLTTDYENVIGLITSPEISQSHHRSIISMARHLWMRENLSSLRLDMLLLYSSRGSLLIKFYHIHLTI